MTSVQQYDLLIFPEPLVVTDEETTRYVAPGHESGLHKSSFVMNPNTSRFYPRYGGGAVRRHTNLYKKGLTRNGKTTRTQRDSGLARILASRKKRN